jgi:hypothetical protein
MLEIKNGNTANATTYGQADAARNGFTNGSNNTTVAINNPPLYGAHTGAANTNLYVEAIVKRQVPNLFMAILGQNTTWVGARSTAAVGGNGVSGCIYALDPTASKALSLAGSNTVTFNCSAYSESNASNAYYSEGSVTLDLSHTSKVGVVGGYQMQQGTYMIDDSNNNSEVPSVVPSPGDPLASIVAPTSGTIISTTPTYHDMNSKPPNNTMNPGVYCGGLTIGNTNGTTFTMAAGTYIMAGGGFNVQSLGIVNATAGVTIYNTSSSGYACSQTYSFAPVNITGQAQLTLNAPTTGSLAGIAMFQDRSITSSSTNQINGQSSTVINGALYFKNSPLLWSGSNISTGYMILVADTITINGNSGLTVNNDYSSLPGGSPIKSTGSSGLVE